MFDGSVTNDGKYLLICASKDCNHINLLSYCDLTAEENKDLKGILKPIPVVTEWIGEFDYVQNHGSKMYFKTNLDAPKAKLISIDFASPDRANWKDVIPESDKSVFDAVRCCNDKAMCAYLENASEKLRIYDFTTGQMTKEIVFPDIGSYVGWAGKHNSNEFFYKFSSFSDPGSQYRVNLDTFEQETV